MQSSRAASLAARLYRRLLSLLPRSLRRELGGPMEELFLDLYAEARERGRRSAGWFLLRAYGEVLSRSLASRGASVSPPGALSLRNVLLDLRFAWRVVTRQRRHTLIALLTVAVGVGATTAVFSVADAALFRPLPFPEPHRLVEIEGRNASGWVSMPLYQEAGAFGLWQEQSELFDLVGGYSAGSMTGLLGGRPSEVYTVRVSPDLLPVLGARPLVGRLLSADDAVEGASPAVVISERVWSREFGRHPEAPGRFLELDGTPHRVVGVLPDTFRFPYRLTDAWLAAAPTRDSGDYVALARLAPDLDPERGTAMAKSLEGELVDVGALPEGWTVELTPLDARRTSERSRTGLLLALGAAGVLLLVAVVNVAQVSLARALERRSELSVRAALGAGRARIVRQVLFESLLLSLSGGLAGMVLARGLVELITVMAPTDLVRLDAIRIVFDWRAFAVGLALAAVAGVAAGLLPAWNAAGPAVSGARHATGASASPARRRTQSTLIVVQAALCLVLLSSAGLLLNSFQRLTAVDPGFDADAVVSMVLLLDHERYPDPEARMAFLDTLAERLRALPQVESAAPAAGDAPVPGGTMLVDWIEGGGERIEESRPVPYGLVGEGFFRTMGIELVAGRAILASDRHSDAVVISEPLARALFGERPAVGQTIDLDSDVRTIVGVAEPVAVFGLDTARDDYQMFGALEGERTPRPYAGIIVRTSGDPAAMPPLLQQTVWSLDDRQPIHRIIAGSETVADWTLEPRFHLLLSGAFASVALLLVLVGVGGVVSQVVASRTHEIGVRVALGASRRSILRLAGLAGVRPVLAGVALGAVGVWQAGRLIASFLFGIEPHDPATLLAVAALFLLAALAASYLPARRALRIDPVRALRAE